MSSPTAALRGQRSSLSSILATYISILLDVWQGLTVATQSDHRTGRRGINMSVCESVPYNQIVFINLRLVSAPLKFLGQELGLQLHEVPAVKSEFKDWRVRRHVI